MDTIDPLRFIFSFAFVIGLIGVLALALRHYSKSQRFFGMAASKDGAGRLQILEVRYLDPRRKLVLVRRDDMEHLLLLADGRELVVESKIAASMIPSVLPDGSHA